MFGRFSVLVHSAVLSVNLEKRQKKNAAYKKWKMLLVPLISFSFRPYVWN